MPPPEQKPVIATTTTSTPAKPSSPAKKRKPYRRYKKNVKIPPVETEEPPEDPAAILERVRLSTIECEICCSDDIAADKVTMCSSGHVFCKDCARRMAEAQIGLRRSELPCMAMEGCGSYLEEAEVREFLAPKTFRLWERLRAEEEIKAAGLHGIEHCPFCDFAAVIESKDEKLFRCYNSECTKVSCRACNREDHIPKSCLEHELALREKSVHEAEEQLSAVLMRRCPQLNCNTPMIKEETVKSCNRMTCAVCKKDMCYCCRKDVSTEGYRHFDMESDGTLSGKCPLWEDSMERHKRDIEDAKRRIGAIAPRRTEAEMYDEEHRRHLLRQQRDGAVVFDVDAAIFQLEEEGPLRIWTEQELHQDNMHNAVMLEKRRRQEQLLEARGQQQRLDLAHRFEAVAQRENRLRNLGFTSLKGLPLFDLGAPIHLGLGIVAPEPLRAPPVEPQPPHTLPVKPVQSSLVPTSQRKFPPAPPSTLRTRSSPPNLVQDVQEGSSSSSSKKQVSNPTQKRNKKNSPLIRATNRAPRHSEP